MRTLSVIVPMYNESDVLPLFVDRLRPVLDKLGTTYEVVAVDDGSTDDTATQLQRIRRTWPELRLVRLRANAGHQAALSAGLAASDGQWTVSLDADLQDPPEVIPDMLAAAEKHDADVVYAVRNDRSTDSTFKRTTAGLFYRLMGSLSTQAGPNNAGDFRLMSRVTVDAVLGLPEHNRVLRLVVPELGFPSTTVEYRREERAAGDSKYPLAKMLRLSLDAITGASIAPLRLATWLGLVGFVASLGLVAYALIAWGSGQVVSGWTSTLAAVAGVGAVQLLCLGIVGEYLGRLYTQNQQRPTYYVAYDSGAVASESRPVDVRTPADVRGSRARQEVLEVSRRGTTAEFERDKDVTWEKTGRVTGSYEPASSADLPATIDITTTSRRRTSYPRATEDSPTSSGTTPGSYDGPVSDYATSATKERRAEILDIVGAERRQRRTLPPVDVTTTDGASADSPSRVVIPEVSHSSAASGENRDSGQATSPKTSSADSSHKSPYFFA